MSFMTGINMAAWVVWEGCNAKSSTLRTPSEGIEIGITGDRASTTRMDEFKRLYVVVEWK